MITLPASPAAPEMPMAASGYYMTARERITLLNVPLDIIDEEQLPFIINELLQNKQAKNIVLLSLWDLLRARRNKDYHAYVTNAALVIPISKSLVSGAQFLTGKKIKRFMPFNFIVKLLITLEERELSVYLLGGKTKILKKTENNIRATFPRLHIVGRYEGGFRKQEAAIIIKAIRKAGPSLLMVGKGVRGEEQWIAHHEANLNRGLRLWCSDIYEVFAKKQLHPSDFTFDHGFDWFGVCLQHPLRFFRFFSYLRYNMLLLGYRLFKREKQQASA
ncbi:MAG: WecB/TagA/CpsF family glycosyltransferase [Treponema sp.]|jgi:N-acetylglucosaminyldiphosphoundecaprenol N-acetyl-beta-D-mannosaminyltransferase|nr:WecB/TagA/CpsF family glycosyltransferase [Treponema sp.]